MKLLVLGDADPNLTEEDGFAPLHVACQNGHLGAVEVLLYAEADPNLATRSGARWFPLHYSAQDGFVDIMQQLLKHGADVNRYRTVRTTLNPKFSCASNCKYSGLPLYGTCCEFVKLFHVFDDPYIHWYDGG